MTSSRRLGRIAPVALTAEPRYDGEHFPYFYVNMMTFNLHTATPVVRLFARRSLPSRGAGLCVNCIEVKNPVPPQKIRGFFLPMLIH